MKKDKVLNAIILMCEMHKISPTDAQKERINEQINRGIDFMLTIDEYLDIRHVVPKKTPNYFRDLLSSRVRFKPIILVTKHGIKDVTKHNFSRIWKMYQPKRVIEIDEKPVSENIVSEIFDAGLPERRKKKPSKMGFQRTTNAYQSMENIGTRMRTAY